MKLRRALNAARSYNYKDILLKNTRPFNVGFYSTYDSVNQYEVAFHVCPTNFRIIQAKMLKAKSSGGNCINAPRHCGGGKTIHGEIKIGLGDGKSRFWGAVFSIW